MDHVYLSSLYVGSPKDSPKYGASLANMISYSRQSNQVRSIDVIVSFCIFLSQVQNLPERVIYISDNGLHTQTFNILLDMGINCLFFQILPAHT